MGHVMQWVRKLRDGLIRSTDKPKQVDTRNTEKNAVMARARRLQSRVEALEIEVQVSERRPDDKP